MNRSCVMGPRHHEVVTMTREEALVTLQAIKRELEENRLTIIREIIDMNRNVVATYRRTVRLPRDSQHGEPQRGGERP